MASRETEERIYALAARQHGLVTRSQLLGAGLGQDAVKHRVRAGRLARLHRGVYRVDRMVSPREREMAALLACGPRAAISHTSAAVVWRLLPPRSGEDPVHVTMRARDRRVRPGVQVHRVDLGRDEVTSVDGLRTTVPSWTVLDLAGTVGARELEQAVAVAERSGLVSTSDLSALLGRRRGRPGVRILRAVLGRGAEAVLTRSEAEERFLTLVRRARLPAPTVNGVLLGYEVDFLWRSERLVVEVDSFAYHGSRGRFERDRRKDAHLVAEGWRVVRVTWTQLATEPEATLARLVRTLAIAAPR